MRADACYGRRRSFWPALAGAALIGAGLGAGAMRLAAGAPRAPVYVACSTAQGPAAATPPGSAVLEPCPPAGTSADQPALVITAAGRLHLAFFARGRWWPAESASAGPIRGEVIAWRWPVAP